MRQDDQAGMCAPAREGVSGQREEIVAIVGDDNPPVAGRGGRVFDIRSRRWSPLGGVNGVERQAAGYDGGFDGYILTQVEPIAPRLGGNSRGCQGSLFATITRITHRPTVALCVLRRVG